MKRSLLLTACLGAVAAPAAAQQAAWERASRYSCITERVIVCREKRRQCSSKPPMDDTLMLIDFEAGTFRPSVVEPERAERIVMKRFEDLGGDDAIHVVVLSGGARVLQFHGARLTNGQNGPGTRASFVTLYGADVHTRRLFCAEQS